ncbi:MAG: NAD(P)/FAD-dependent oxidoreductase [Cyclobacteriaceae bacterium]
MKDIYDAVIIGSGLGGLACGAMLAKEGYRVCVVERNKQIGGTLQTFVRDKNIFDSGVHYVGGLDPGQNLNQIFKHLEIMDKVKIRKMDEDGFDGMMFGDDPKTYWYAQGYDNFIQKLALDFPDEEEAIRTYCDKVRDVCNKFPLYNLEVGDYFDKMNVLEIETKAYLESITDNKTLQNVLAGTSLLYAGEAYKTPFYVHALVVNSYIQSSFRFVDGGSQIARLLAKVIKSNGGTILKGKNVNRIVEEGGSVEFIETDTNEKFFGKLFISSIHPQQTMEMTASPLIKKAFRSRLEGLQNSVSTFYISIVLKKGSLRYQNKNYYYFAKNDAWSALEYTPETWPTGYALYFSAISKNTEYAEAITLMTYMHFEDVAKWKDTFNTVLREGDRGKEYELFKKERAEKLFASVEKRFPGFTDSINKYYVATPLTLRDYMGTNDGSMYGVVKDYKEPMRTFISPRTKIPNLYLTGQNLNLHGVLGVAVSAVVTCSEILGGDYLLTKIRDA